VTPLLPALVLLFQGTGCTDSTTVQDTDTATVPVDPGCADVDTTGHTVGLLACEPGGGTGYTLVAPLESTTTFLVDAWGRVVHTWAAEHPVGASVYLQDDGSLIRPSTPSLHPVFQRGGTAGQLAHWSWDSELLWQVALSSVGSVSHHDVAPLPDGDVLVLSWEAWTEEQALAVGRDPATLVGKGLWVEVMEQLHPTGPDTADVVWAWHAADHLIQDFDPELPNHGVVAESPGRLDLNPPGSVAPDFLHVNAVDYDPVHDRIVLSSLGFSEAWVIDHDTTTAEAAGPAGDLIYRWGNPQSYGPYDGPDQDFHGQHDVHWIPEGLPGAGDLLLFDNGPPGQTGPLSRAMQVTLPLDDDGDFTGFDGRWGPEAFAWAWPEPPTGQIASDQLGSAQRLENGHTLICEGEHGRLIEVTAAGDVAWEWTNPIASDVAVAQGDVPAQGTAVRANALFRATRIPADHPGLLDRDLTPGVLLEEWVAPEE
jgi:hypothetical protein